MLQVKYSDEHQRTHLETGLHFSFSNFKREVIGFLRRKERDVIGFCGQ
jgi:hypothetical protein